MSVYLFPWKLAELSLFTLYCLISRESSSFLIISRTVHENKAARRNTCLNVFHQPFPFIFRTDRAQGGKWPFPCKSS